MTRGRLTVFGVLLAAAAVALWLRPWKSEGTALTTIGGDADRIAALATRGAAAGYDVLVVTFDTTRSDHIGCYGGAARTPTIDGLARNGIRFSSATTVAPITLPAHSSLWTGLIPPRHGVRNNGTFALDATALTMAEILGGAGYDTAAFISAFVLEKRYGLAQGFSTYDDVMPAQSRGGNHFTERPAHGTTDAALQWLEPRLTSAKPWFLWLHYFDPHSEYTPPPAAGRDGHPYDREIAWADLQLGRIIAALRRSGRIDRTLIVFTADHGEGLGDHDEATHSVLTYEATMAIPLIFSCPTLFDRPLVADDRIASIVDVMPTVLARLGVGLPGDVDGRDLFGPPDTDRAVYFESMMPLLNHGWGSLHGLRRLGDKYIHGPDPEYYDLVADPGEEVSRTDLPASKELARRLNALMEPFGSPLEVVAKEVPLDPVVAARLATMGYGRSINRPSSRGRANPRRMMRLWGKTVEANALSEAGRHDDARRAIEFVLKGDPDNGRAWFIAALIHRRTEDVLSAEACLRNALRLSPRADGWVMLGQLLMVQSRFGEADQALSKAEAMDPLDGGLHLARGDSLAVRGRFEEALPHYERSLEVDPSNWGGRARAKIVAAKQRIADQRK